MFVFLSSRIRRTSCALVTGVQTCALPIWRLRSPRLVKFFANDRPAVAAAAMSRARLSDAAWVEMLPRLTPTARGVLRSRRDLGPATLQGLEAFGATDLVLTSDVVVEQEIGRAHV